VRRYLGAALGAAGDPRGIPVLLRLLHDKDPDHFIQIWAASGLGQLGCKDGIPVMIELLHLDETKTYRGNISATLEELTGTRMKFNDDYDSWHNWWEREGRAKFARPTD
jgi:HEAT repeat protein